MWYVHGAPVCVGGLFNTATQCQTAGGPGKKVRLSVEDLRRALSRPADAKKLARMEELLFMQEDIKRARAQLDLP